MSTEILEDGTAILRTDQDPAVNRVKGWSRYWLGVDLGQSQDYTALTILLDECLPEWESGHKQILGPRRRTVVHADKFKGVSYPDIVAHVLRTMSNEKLRGKVRLIVDGSGLGRVVSDLLTDASVPHTAIQMVAGQNWARKGRYVNVGKTLLLENLSVMFATGDLSFVADLPLRQDILHELETFQLEMTAAGNQVITQGKVGTHHGDLAISLAIAAFASEYLKPGVIGSHRLEGFY